ncbi:unnamed protein product [Allacma fusca]|uniref:Peptidase S8/S53 domain-containing protein n=1 Tax=Allacma fusca TaxID=39272 RepID=A0A8J2JRQ7_9HEXA|nr:unnamed protein product [Allacma fusca]
MRFQIALLALGFACAAISAPVVDPTISKTLSEKGSVDIFVTFKNDKTASIRDKIKHQTFLSRTSRIQSLYNALKSHADQTQKDVLAFLNQYKSTNSMWVHQLWVTNQIIVKGADKTLIEQLSLLPEINELIQDQIIPMMRPIESSQTSPREGEQWGVALIDAPSVWEEGNRGNGTIVASIDTGVRYTHEALKDGLLPTNNWFDPGARTSVPTDTNGHGTHTMGTICGRTKGIGVAPEAQWISCRGCPSSCPRTDLTACAQFMVCPTDPDGSSNPRCDLAPNLVSNSWGGGQDDPWYDPYIDSWITAGIAALFSNGNSGPSCHSANSPADSLAEPIAVGSTTSSDQVSSFSSVGPTIRFRRFKPDVSAPGSDVYSSYYSSDTSYTTMSGTSMACPHTAGLAALLLSARADLSHQQIRDLLVAGAQPTRTSNGKCGDINDTNFPNYHAGHGRISARASIDELNRWAKS